MIERIIIENFKSIRKLDLELKPINILIGANGAGKSNFVSFFNLANSVCFGDLSYFIGNNINSFLHFGRKKSKFFYGLIDIENIDAVYFFINPVFNSNSGYIHKLGLHRNNSNNLDKNYNEWELVYEEQDKKQSMLYQIDEPYDEKIYEYIDRLITYHFQDVSEGAKIKLPNKINDNRQLNENGSNLTAFLYLIQEKHPKDFHKIENQIRSVASFFDRFDLAPDRLNENQIELRWLEKGSDDYFNAYDLSDGTLRFMALTTLLMQPDLPKTIIIDEPELGLHPFAINKLAAMMKQAVTKGSQVIVSTQSVGLIDNFEPEDIITVDREDDQSVFKRLNSEDLNDWLEDYTLGELWNKNVIGARP